MKNKNIKISSKKRNKGLRNKIGQVMMAIVVVLGFSMSAVPVQAATATATTKIDAKAALAVDLESGKVLLEQNADQSLPIASMTKILTLYLVQEAISNNKLKNTDTIKVPASIANFSQDPALSNVPLTAGESYTVKELYDSGWIYSSNAAAMLLADKVAGSQKKFVEQMKVQLKKWKITDAQIVNVSGLNNSDIPAKLRVSGTSSKAENQMSATDLAVVARHLLQKYPETLKITKTVEKTFAPGGTDEFVMHNFNRMLPGEPDSFGDLTVDGLKTGTTDAAGESFVGTTKQDRFRIITVVMDAHGDADDKGKRFKDTVQIMRDVYNTWTSKVVYQKGQTNVVKPLNLKYGKEKTVKLAPNKAVTVWSKNDQEPKTQMMLRTTGINSTKKGEVFGTVKVADDGLGYLPGTTGDVQIVATRTVSEKNFFAKIGQNIGEFFGNLF